MNHNRSVNPRTNMGAILWLVLACAGCGGESKEDFSKPLVMPKAPPLPVAVKPDWVPGKTPVPADGQPTAKQPAVTAAIPEQVAPATELAKVDAPKSGTPAAVSPTTENAPTVVAKPSVSPELKPNPTTASVAKTSTAPKEDAPKTESPKAETKTSVEPLTADEREWLRLRQRQAISGDGQFAVTGLIASRLSVHDVQSRSLAQEHFGQASAMTALAIGPQRSWVVGADESGSLRLWTPTQTTAGLDRFARESLRKAEAARPTVRSEQRVVRVIAAHPDGRSLLTGGEDGSLHVWNVTSQDDGVALQKGRRWQAHEGPISALAISADGRWIVSGGEDRNVQLWDATTGTLSRSWVSLKAAISDVAVSADGKIVAASAFSKSAVWWSVEEPKPAAATVAASTPVKTTPGLPNPQTDEEPVVITRSAPAIPTSFEHPDIVLSIAVSPDGKQVLTGCKDKLVRIWDLATGRNTGRLEPAKDGVVEVRYLDGDKRLLARDRSGFIRNRPRVAVASNDDEDSPQIVQSAGSEWLFTTPPELLVAATSAATSPLAATDADDNSRLVGLLANLRLTASRTERDDARSAYFFPVDPTAADNTENAPSPPTRWKPPSNAPDRSERPQLIGSLTTAFQFAHPAADGPRTAPHRVQLSLSADGEFLSAFEVATRDDNPDERRRPTKKSHHVWLWDVPTQGLLRHWDDLADAPATLQFVDVRNQFVSPSTAQCFSLVSGEATNLKNLCVSETLHHCVLSPDGQRLAAVYVGAKQATKNVVRLFDAETFERLATYEAFESIGTAIEFTPDGSSLLVAIRERQMHRLLQLDATTLAVQATLEEQSHPQPWLQGSERESATDLGITRLVFSPDGRAVVSVGSYGSGDFRLTLWERKGSKWVREPRASAKSAQPFVAESLQPTPLWFVGGKANQLAAIGAKGLAIVDTSNGRLLRGVDLKDGPRDRGPCAWSSDGLWFVQGDNVGNVALWSLRSDKEPGYFTAQLGPVKALALSHDGQMLATLGEENQLHVWNLAGWQPKNRVIAKAKPPVKLTPSSD